MPINLSMSVKWFVQKSDAVEGPFSADEVKSRLNTGEFQLEHLVWGHGLDHWRPLQWWMESLPQLANAATTLEHVHEMWHYAYQGESHGPLPRADFLNKIKDVPNLGEIMVWTKGMKEWVPLFEFHDMLTEMGINRRQYPRADLAGKAVIKVDGITLIAQILTVSEGGFGLQLESGLNPGQVVTVELHSQSLSNTIHAKAECRYVSQGVAGMRFTQISVENKGAIIQFVRQSQTRFAIKAS